MPAAVEFVHVDCRLRPLLDRSDNPSLSAPLLRQNLLDPSPTLLLLLIVTRRRSRLVMKDVVIVKAAAVARARD